MARPTMLQVHAEALCLSELLRPGVASVPARALCDSALCRSCCKVQVKDNEVPRGRLAGARRHALIHSHHGMLLRVASCGWITARADDSHTYRATGRVAIERALLVRLASHVLVGVSVRTAIGVRSSKHPNPNRPGAFGRHAPASRSCTPWSCACRPCGES